MGQLQTVHSTNPDRSQSWSLALCDGNVGNGPHSDACQRSLRPLCKAKRMLVTFGAYINMPDVWPSKLAWSCLSFITLRKLSLWGPCLSVLSCFLKVFKDLKLNQKQLEKAQSQHGWGFKPTLLSFIFHKKKFSRVVSGYVSEWCLIR